MRIPKRNSSTGNTTMIYKSCDIVDEGLIMIILRRHLILVSVVSVMVVFSGAIIWGATRASIPDDVRSKLGQDLIDVIQLGTMNTEHDCIIACSSSEAMYTIIDSLQDDSVEKVWESFGMFRAFLTPGQIFDIARIDDVIRIDYNSEEIVI